LIARQLQNLLSALGSLAGGPPAHCSVEAVGARCWIGGRGEPDSLRSRGAQGRDRERKEFFPDAPPFVSAVDHEMEYFAGDQVRGTVAHGLCARRLGIVYALPGFQSAVQQIDRAGWQRHAQSAQQGSRANFPGDVGHTQTRLDIRRWHFPKVQLHPRLPAESNRLLLISSAARFTAACSASAADIFTSGSTPVPSQSVFVTGLTNRPNGTRMKK